MDSGDSVAFALPCSFPRNEGVIIRREKDYGVGRVIEDSIPSEVAVSIRGLPCGTVRNRQDATLATDYSIYLMPFVSPFCR